MGAAQGAREVAAQHAGQREVRARGERGPLDPRLGGHCLRTLEMLDRLVELPGPHLDDPELGQDQATQVGGHRLAVEHRAAPEPIPRRREGSGWISAEASLIEPHGGGRSDELRSALRRHAAHRCAGAAQVGLGQRLLAEGEHRGPEGQRQLGAGIDALTRHGLQNRPQRSHLAVDHEVDPVVDDELRAQVPHLSHGHVTQCRRAIAMRSEPDRGTPVQLLERRAELRAQLCPQQLREERVVAVPVPVVVERRQQRAAMLEAGEHSLTVGAAGQRIGELTAHRVDDRRAQEEVAQVGRLAGQHLAEQVVAHRGIGAREVLDESLWLGMGADRHGRQAQPRRPAFGAPPQRRDLGGCDRHVEGLEQRGGLVGRERQVARADLRQPALETQPAEPDRRVRARDQHQPQSRRRVAHEPFDVLAHDVDHLVQVVEDEHDGLIACLERVDQRREDEVHVHAARAG